MTIRKIRHDQRGVSAVEFALAAPVMLSMVIGLGQLGTLFFANAGLQHSVEQAARVAAVYPTPANAVILAEFQDSRFGTNGTLTPTLTEGTDDGMDVMDVSASYTVPLEFIFFDITPVTLTHTRRVFLQEASTFVSGTTRPSTTSTTSTTSTGGTTGSTSTTSSTSTGGTTSASSTSTGGTSATSSTSSSTTSGSSGNSNSSSGNGSSGNGNGSSSSSSGGCKNNC